MKFILLVIHSHVRSVVTKLLIEMLWNNTSGTNIVESDHILYWHKNIVIWNVRFLYNKGNEVTEFFLSFCYQIFSLLSSVGPTLCTDLSTNLRILYYWCPRLRPDHHHLGKYRTSFSFFFSALSRLPNIRGKIIVGKMFKIQTL